MFDLLDVPFGYIATLRYIIDRESRNKNKRDEKQAEVIEDAVNGDI